MELLLWNQDFAHVNSAVSILYRRMYQYAEDDEPTESSSLLGRRSMGQNFQKTYYSTPNAGPLNYQANYTKRSEMNTSTYDSRPRSYLTSPPGCFRWILLISSQARTSLSSFECTSKVLLPCICCNTWQKINSFVCPHIPRHHMNVNEHRGYILLYIIIGNAIESLYENRYLVRLWSF